MSRRIPFILAVSLTVAVTSSVAQIGGGHKRMGLECIYFVICKRSSFVLGMSGLTASFTRLFVFCLSRRLNNIRRWRFGGIGRILREFSDFISKLGNLFFKSSNALIALFELLFKFSNVLNIELFCFGSQIPSSSSPVRLLSDKFRGFLENNIDMPP